MKSDGILQVSIGGATFTGGEGGALKGAISLADHIRTVAETSPVCLALHTDHCTPKDVESFLVPLVEETAKRRAKGLPNLFNGHMFDGSSLPLKENLKEACRLLKKMRRQ